MPSGKLGSADLLAVTDTLIYTVPASKIATVNVRVANRNAASIRVRVAVGSGAVPSGADYLSFDMLISGNGLYEDTGIVMSAGEKLWVYSSLANVSVRAHGMEG
ncbi:hypothetical protein [Pseudomonas sp. DSP3-2-2]|uniref:hypothetical protein n=1 Tax=unclassified Pseudomonas TaxID=196821 RepID=UPI003CF149DE